MAMEPKPLSSAPLRSTGGTFGRPCLSPLCTDRPEVLSGAEVPLERWEDHLSNPAVCLQTQRGSKSCHWHPVGRVSWIRQRYSGAEYFAESPQVWASPGF